MKKRLPLSRGTILQSRYRVLRQLGHGGMGAVYEAADARFKNRLVALKETYADSDETRRAFQREAQLLAKTEHEAFPRVMDYFSEGDGYFLVMELIRGKDLADLLKEQIEPFEQEQVLRWADQILDALEDLHSNRIIHRDIKPSNLKLTPKGRLKLLDFGIAKGFTDSDAAKITTIGSLAAATLQYAPLEQVLKANIDWFSALSVNYPEKTSAILHKSTDEPSDLYALSATLYQFLTNQLPVNAPTRALAIWAGLPDKMLPPHEIDPRISPLVSAFLQKGLELDRKDRFHSAREMRSALMEVNSKLTEKAKAVYEETKPVLSANESLAPFDETESKENAFGRGNFNSVENNKIIENFQPGKQFVVDLSSEVRPEGISIVTGIPVELKPGIISSDPVTQETFCETGTKIPIEKGTPVFAGNQGQINHYGRRKAQKPQAFDRGDRLPAVAEGMEPGFEPKLLFQHQGSLNKSRRTVSILLSACMISGLCIVLGMATFQQSAKIRASEQTARESATTNPVILPKTPPPSSRQKNISISYPELTVAKKKADSPGLAPARKPIEKSEGQKPPKSISPPAEPTRQSSRVINRKKERSKSSADSDCIFSGKC